MPEGNQRPPMDHWGGEGQGCSNEFATASINKKHSSKYFFI